ncbi:MAG: 2-amino-4-hydroxy-6-hydroxymethyldihydropteridine diphosphokinase [Bacillota bacterium]|jgi:2-amino-4-hydroxy-6-hydroxymethyldihydropteridine diphosphokinase
MTQTAYIGLGSNLGDREQTLMDAVKHIHQLEGVAVAYCSSLYETDPVGNVNQPAFLNMVIRVKTSLDPDVLLQQMLAVELQLGRVREVHWGPRTIDLDLLRVDDKIINTELLTLPHPFMRERAFVLVPLLECCSTEDETFRIQIEQDLLGLPDREGVARWKTCNWQDGFAPSES